MSLAEIVMLCEVSSSKLTSETVARTGASLIGSIETLTLAVSESSPSLTLNVKLSEPLKSVFGVYVAIFPLIEIVPFSPFSTRL